MPLNSVVCLINTTGGNKAITKVKLENPDDKFIWTINIDDPQICSTHYDK